MGQGRFGWFRPFRSRNDKYRIYSVDEPTLPSSSSTPDLPTVISPDYSGFFPREPEPQAASSSDMSSSIPFHANSPTAHLRTVNGLFAADLPPVADQPTPLPFEAALLQMQPQVRAKSTRRSRRAAAHAAASVPDGPRSLGWKQAELHSRVGYAQANRGYVDSAPLSMPQIGRSADWKDPAVNGGIRGATGAHMGEGGYADSAAHGPYAILSPGAYGREPSAADEQQPGSLDFSRMPPSFASDMGNDEGVHAVGIPAGVPPGQGTLEKFVAQRPNDRAVPASDGLAKEMRVSITTPDLPSMDIGSVGVMKGTDWVKGVGTYQKKLGGIHNRFMFRRRTSRRHSDGGQATPLLHAEDEYFGTRQHDERDKTKEIRKGEEVLLRFLHNTLGPKAQNLAVRLMNKTPITTSNHFSYVVHQGTEDSDVDIIRRDLVSGRLYTNGVRLVGGGWSNLLLGDRFIPGNSARQRHELTYRRASCSCIICMVKAAEILRAQNENNPDYIAADLESSGMSAELLSTMSTARTPTHSAMANFVVRCRLPSNAALMSIGASSSSRELEIGSVVRLNYRASAKLKFTEDVRELFGHFAYTGPISHEEVYRRVTTIGVHYYLYNKGKKERKVYIQGELIRLPVQVGVVKLGTQPMYMPELGATFCLHRKQIMSIYVGEIVLEGNSIGSFIKTGIRYYIGFGEERGVCPVYPNKTLGKARKLGINELLLHHHMVEDLEVRCV